MPDLFPLVQEAHICLRCQYRLASYGAKRFKTARHHPTNAHARSFSSQSQLLQGHARVVPQDPFDVPATLEAISDQSADAIELPKDLGQIRTVKAPTPKSTYFYKRATLYSRDPLGINTLGKPVEVLRLQDSPPKKRENLWWQVQKEEDNVSRSAEPLTSSDILDRVNAERGLVSEARAIHNIDALKQEWQSRLKDQQLGPTQSEYDDLHKRLTEGFTMKQLWAYMNQPITPIPQVSTSLSHPFQSTLYSRSEWKAGLTTFSGSGTQRLHDVTANSKSLHTYGHKLIRQTWGIRSREELQRIGEVDVRIHETYLDLISSHRNDPKSLEAAQTLLGQCQKPLREAKTAVFSSADKAALDTLAPLPVEAAKSLPLTDRGISWTRLCSDIREKVNYGQGSAQPPIGSALALALESAAQHIRPSEPSDYISALSEDVRKHKAVKNSRNGGKKSKWEMNGVEETSAMLGQVLFPANTVRSQKMSLWDPTQPHVMNTDVPRIRKALVVLGEGMELRQEVRMRFHSASYKVPWKRGQMNKVPARKLPDLEVRCIIQAAPDGSDERGEVILDSARLVLEDRQADVILPHQPMDMRFERRVYLDATATPDARIAKFIKSCNLSNPDLDPVFMPQGLKISVPPSILKAAQEAGQKDLGKSKLRDYSLANVERHWIMHNKAGRPIMFSTIDAGALGGRTQEFRFLMRNEKQGALDKVKTLWQVASNILEKTREDHSGMRTPREKISVRYNWTDIPVDSREYKRPLPLNRVGPIRRVNSDGPVFQRWV
ncbi:MAG: hypothetical protein LQ350_002342 [Teloschistes chrysophthalmus]|nr:MAG: hypothetical protein LQ350_002342 [Niorma chrysophthalma]